MFLTRKDNHTPTKESQVEKSSVANITGIKNVTINQTQPPKCQRRTPAHSKIFCWCTSKTQGKEKLTKWKWFKGGLWGNSHKTPKN